MNQLPSEFLKNMQEILGDEFGLFLASLEIPSPVSVRLNPSKRISKFDSCEKVPWATDAFYLDNRISFTLDPYFHAGCYYVQEASSMFLETALKQILPGDIPVKILDLCASPGGKSTHILSTLSPGSLLVSNEVVSARNVVLQQNITRWGNHNTVITQNEAADFNRLPGFFDIIVVDAPCSGEGLFRKQSSATEEWSPGNVQHCAHRQNEILDSIYDSLKEGGYLVYSTCTFENTENELQCKRLIDEYEMRIVEITHPHKELVQTSPGLRFYPHRIKGEGFYISVLQKMQTSSNISTKKKKQVSQVTFPSASQYMNDMESFDLFRKNDDIYAFHSTLHTDIGTLMEKLFVRKAGIHLGTIKGKDFVPDHELALSNNLHDDVTRQPLDEKTALQFLRCENISLPEVPTGWAVACFDGFPLGWMKGVGNRINNYFPRSQRILKAG